MMNTITSCALSVASNAIYGSTTRFPESPAVLLVGRVRMKFGSQTVERTSMCSQARDERRMWDRYMYITGTI